MPWAQPTEILLANTLWSVEWNPLGSNFCFWIVESVIASRSVNLICSCLIVSPVNNRANLVLAPVQDNEEQNATFHHAREAR